MVWYILFIIFATYVMLPLPLLWAVLASGASVVIHLITFLVLVIINPSSPWEVMCIKISLFRQYQQNTNPVDCCQSNPIFIDHSTERTLHCGQQLRRFGPLHRHEFRRSVRQIPDGSGRKESLCRDVAILRNSFKSRKGK